MLKADGTLSAVLPGQPPLALIHTKGFAFRTPQFSDLILEFVVQTAR